MIPGYAHDARPCMQRARDERRSKTGYPYPLLTRFFPLTSRPAPSSVGGGRAPPPASGARSALARVGRRSGAARHRSRPSIAAAIFVVAAAHAHAALAPASTRRRHLGFSDTQDGGRAWTPPVYACPAATTKMAAAAGRRRRRRGSPERRPTRASALRAPEAGGGVRPPPTPDGAGREVRGKKRDKRG